MAHRGVGRWAAQVAAVVVGAVLLGCGSDATSSPGTPDVAAVRLSSGAVQVHLSSCYDGTVGAIVVRRAAERDDLLWAAQSGELEPDGFDAVHLTDFTIGVPPSGFHETQPLVQPLSGHEPFTVTFVGEGTLRYFGMGISTFRYDELPSSSADPAC